MKRWMGVFLLLVVLLSACGTGTENRPDGLVTVYKLPT